MKVSWNWLSEWVDLSGAGGPEGLDRILTSRGLEVENREELSKGFEHVVAAKILSKERHPQADRLSLCRVDAGPKGSDLQIVCGATNMKAGDIVCLAQVGALLPNGMKIAASKIRGVESFGMLCSESELGLKESSEGILILPSVTKPGTPVAAVLGREDTIFELKLTANRSDCLSVYGLAREVAAALKTKVKTPKDYREEKLDFVDAGSSKIKLKLEAGQDGPQFYGCLIEGVKVGPAPEAWRKKLESIGARSINNLVDATNLVLHELGHPVHAYDADRIEGASLSISFAKKGEAIPLLDGTKVEATSEDLVIRDGKGAVGLAGVMGGGNSEIQDSSKRVLLECALFNPIRVRRTSSRHSKKTEASHRFERGVDPLQLSKVISRLASLVLEASGGRITQAMKAVSPSHSPETLLKERPKIRVGFSYFTDFLGFSVSTGEVESILGGLGISIEKKGQELICTPPSYRMDLLREEDLAEEIARCMGYDKIPATLPRLGAAPLMDAFGGEAEGFRKLGEAKDALSAQGFTEVLNYSFTSKDWLRHFGERQKFLPVLNPLSEEQEVMTPSLIPALVKNALTAFHRHFGSDDLGIRLFEIRPGFSIGTDGDVHAHGKDPSRPDQTGTLENWKVALLGSGPRFSSALQSDNPPMDFYDWKGAIENFLISIGVHGIRMKAAQDSDVEMGFFHPGQCAEVWLGNKCVGRFGRMHPGAESKLKIKQALWLAELDWDLIRTHSIPSQEARALGKLPEFPPMVRDFSVLVKEDVPSEQILQCCLKAGKPLAKSAKIFDLYQGAQVQKGSKSVSVRVLFSEPKRSLVESEVEDASNAIISALSKEIGAELR